MRSFSCGRWAVALLFVVCLAGSARGQSDGLLQVHDPLQEYLLRQYALGRLPDAFLVHQPLSVPEAQRYLDSLALRSTEMDAIDRQLLRRYRLKDSTRVSVGVGNLPGLLGQTYQNGLDFASTAGDDGSYGLQVNPLLYLSAGYARRTGVGAFSNEDLILWQNTRGLRLSGHIGENIFFESRIEETQRVPAIAQVERRTAPRLGNVKFDGQDASSAYDYSLATGMVGLRSRYFELRFGRDRNLWGLGRSSVQLSNFAPGYEQIQLRTTLGSFQYVNLFASFSDLSGLSDDFRLSQNIPRKYGTFHRLAYNLGPTMQFGLFESVVFAPDSLRPGFDMSYLNPVIFYRTVEADQGSAGNAVIGGDFAWVVRRGMQFYTQFLFDELRINELRQPGRGWWGNKWSWLMGFYFVDPLPNVENMTFRVEYTRTRPFTYTHFIANQGYTHYNDLLAHPSGPNAEDLALFLTYQPTQKLFSAVNFAMTLRGRSEDGENVGDDPRLSYETRDGDFNHSLLQGVPQNFILVEAHAGYELLPLLFVEGALRYEYLDDGEQGTSQYIYPFLSLRWGLPFQSNRY